MGEPNAALGVYMNHPGRIRSVLEYYLGQKLPERTVCCGAVVPRKGRTL